jgi:hypothetical protein
MAWDVSWQLMGGCFPNKHCATPLLSFVGNLVLDLVLGCLLLELVNSHWPQPVIKTCSRACWLHAGLVHGKCTDVICTLPRYPGGYPHNPPPGGGYWPHQMPGMGGQSGAASVKSLGSAGSLPDTAEDGDEYSSFAFKL